MRIATILELDNVVGKHPACTLAASLALPTGTLAYRIRPFDMVRRSIDQLTFFRRKLNCPITELRDWRFDQPQGSFQSMHEAGPVVWELACGA
jgi:hypothetical protein